MLTKLNNRSADEGDVVELLEPLPDYGFRAGQRGIVMSQFQEPSEAYDLEMEDEDGNFIGFAYAVLPIQFRNVSESLLEEGLEALGRVDLPVAAEKLRAAADLNPRTRGVVMNSVLANVPDSEIGLINILRFLSTIYPQYEIVRDNLGIALLNFAVSHAKRRDFQEAVNLLVEALGLTTSDETAKSLQETLARVLTEQGQQALEENNYEGSLQYLMQACSVFPSQVTRENLRLAYIFRAGSFMEQRQYGKALPDFAAANELGSLPPDLLNDFALALVTIGKTQEAIDILEIALEIDPHQPALLDNLARVKNSESLKRNPTKPDHHYAAVPVRLLNFQPALGASEVIQAAP